MVMNRDEIHGALAGLEDQSGIGRRAFARAVHEFLSVPRGHMSVTRAAEVLGVSERRVRQLCAGGELSHRRSSTGKIWVSPYSVHGRLSGGRFKEIRCV